ncbi:MAG: [protein-PII] uridylyltransferase, partial [Pseudomonadota bacterium]
REDRLLFDHQRALAEQFGYSDDDASLAVEKFMQDYYRTVMELQRLNEMLMQHFRESILQGGNLAHPVSINRRFQACDGYLEIVSDDVFQRRPLALLEVFLIMQQHPELQGVRASTIRAIRAHRHLIDRRFRASLTARSLFMEILREPEGLTRELRRMNRYGILACYLPAFANIVGRMQYDLFHIYTVDEHTLVLIRNLRRLTAEIHKSEFPLLSKIMTRLPKPELIYIAGLFHDIAKGRGGDHSTLGAEDARVFCQDHGLSDYDTNLVTWLVEDHLLMSMTAQRKDIDDPEVVQVFAQQVGDANRLNYLYLLTVADIRATNPERWNSWVNGLLRGLFLNTRKAIARGLDNPQAQDELIQEKQTEARRLMANSGIEAKAITALWMNLSLDYFLLATPEEVAWQTVTVLSTPPEERPVVIVRPNQARGGTEIFMCASDSANLFAISAQLLDQLRLNIVEARIQTASPGCAMNTFLVLEDNGDLIDEGARTQEVIEVLSASLEENAPIPAGVSRRAHRQLKHFEIPAEVTFTQDPGNQRTTLHLVAADRPGLLSLIGYAFAECGIRVISARITTIGAKVEDFFILTDRTNQPLTDPDIQGCVERGILQRLQDADASET